jgi:hypothetical protein
LSCLVLSCLMRAPCWANARSSLGSAAALLASCPPPTTTTPNSKPQPGLLGPACGAGRPSPEFPCPYVWCLGPRLVNVVSLRKQSNFLCM